MRRLGSSCRKGRSRQWAGASSESMVQSRRERISSRRKPAQTAADVLCPRSAVWVWQESRPRRPPREAWAGRDGLSTELARRLEAGPMRWTSGGGQAAVVLSLARCNIAKRRHRIVGCPVFAIAPDSLAGHAGVVMQWKGAAASQFQACPLPNPPNLTRDDDRAVAPCLIVCMQRGGAADRTRRVYIRGAASRVAVAVCRSRCGRSCQLLAGRGSKMLCSRPRWCARLPTEVVQVGPKRDAKRGRGSKPPPNPIGAVAKHVPNPSVSSRIRKHTSEQNRHCFPGLLV